MLTSKTILLVEDDPGLRLIVKKVLEKYGYTVLPAEDSVIANSLARMHGGIVDLLLADINLPGLTGSEYAAFRKDINPNLKVLYMSGSLEDALVRQHLRHKTAAFLAKPFSNEELVLAVKRALGEIAEVPEDGE